jgi:hypothetical protein
VREPQTRLACYDDAFGAPAEAPPVKENTAAKTAELPRPSQSPAPAAAANTAAPVDARSREQEFGLSPQQQARRANPSPQPVEAAEPTSITAAVTELRKQATGQFLAVLDNGQIWVQRETNTRVRLSIGEQVTIRRGTLGSYLLEGSSGLATRVRRVK